ncbi:hypothetical protein [Flavobacterium mekongense]|uniref:hypothetical protein n=1 Tax=Flavobacterium mekongense TaxID=3379707 RepID=UPI00399A5C6F
MAELIVEEEELNPVQINTDVLYQQDKAQVDIQISTAKQYPRNITRSVENMIAIVTIDQRTAESCTYAVPRGGKVITGPSVHLAKIIAQNWKNLRIENRVIEIGPRQLTSQGICWDLENNIAIKTEVKRSIMTKNGRMNDDLITVTGNAANSIALRNAVFSVVPRGVVDKVYNEALKMITGDLSDETKLIKRRKQVVDALKDSFEITEEEILKSVGKSSINHLTADNIAVLIGFGTSIKNGDATVETIFKGQQTQSVEEKKAEVKAAKDAAKTAAKNTPEETAKTTETGNQSETVNPNEVDFYLSIQNCKTIEDVQLLEKQIPATDHDLLIALDEKKKEILQNPGLFSKEELK